MHGLPECHVTLFTVRNILISTSPSRDVALTKKASQRPVATISINSFNVLNHRNDMTYIGVVGSPSANTETTPI
jgi:hypothetical protein